MTDQSVLTHYDLTLRPDPSRTVLKPFDPQYPEDMRDAGKTRFEGIAQRLMGIGEVQATSILSQVLSVLGERHHDLPATLRTRFEDVKRACAAEAATETQALLIGAYFIAEYSFEAAALFNPSIVLAPDQSGCPEGGVYFVLSLRGIGEGHISSVTFRTGCWVPGTAPVIDPPSRHAATPIIEGEQNDEDNVVTLRWNNIGNVSEAVLFPVLRRHRQGIEDARFVRFIEDDGNVQYYATVTGFSGSAIRGEMICAGRLDGFDLHPLSGKAARNKGMALFPRRVDGRYMMLGRQDNENLWLLRSDDLFVWDDAEKLLAPKWPWEFVQIGNCGSPIEIDEGWLVMTHGVGPARSYCIGACLLDKADPAKVLGRTTFPLIHPDDQDRDGYVPNVVYSCGSLVLNRHLLLPYGVADSVTRFATGSVDAILAAMTI